MAETIRRGRRARVVRTALVAGALAWVLGGAQLAQATPVTMNANYPVAAIANVHFSATNCTSQSSEVEISGTIDLGSVYFRVRLSNNAKGTKTSTGDQIADVGIKPNNGVPIVINKQPVRSGVGGNPWISFDLDLTDNVDPVVIGRCVQGASYDVTQAFVNVPGFASAVLSATNCDTKRSDLAVDMGSGNGGANGTLYFDNNINKVVHRQDAAGSVDVTLVDAIPFTKGVKGQSATGAGGNPHVYGLFYRPPAGFSGTAAQAFTASANAGGWRSTTADGTWVGRCKDLRP